MRRTAPIAAVVPVRGLGAGKQRLAAVLSAAERRDLVHAMLEDVLQGLSRLAQVMMTVVVSGDAAVARVAERMDALLLPDAPGSGLNPSLQAALAWVGAACPDHAALVVAADLPTLTPSLLEATVMASDADVVIARSVDGGTNILLQQPPATLKLAFGAGSCARHRDAAIRAGRSVEVIDHPVLARDLDGPADLAAVLPLLEGGRTLQILRHGGGVARPDAGREQSASGGF